VLFTEPTFLFLFLPILLALYFSTFRRVHSSYGNWLPLIFSIIFYAKGGGSFTRLILGSIVFNYFVAIAVDRARGSTPSPRPAARRCLAFAVAANLVLLGIFKYTNFFADNVNTLFLLLRVRPVVVPRVLLPIGISFFTFHAISYVVDVYRRDATAQKSPVHAALYLLLFPQLIAGPIIRYRTIADQLARRVVTLDDFAYGVRRFVVGLAKKVLIASAFLKAMAGLGRAAPTPYTVRWYLTSEVWLALAAGAVGSTPWVPALAARFAVARRPAVARSASLVATATRWSRCSLASIMQVAAGTYNPFIYFQF